MKLNSTASLINLILIISMLIGSSIQIEEEQDAFQNLEFTDYFGINSLENSTSITEDNVQSDQLLTNDRETVNQPQNTQLNSILFEIGNNSYEYHLQPGKIELINLTILPRLLHSPSLNNHISMAFFFSSDCPFSKLMYPRMEYIAQKFPNITIFAINSTELSAAVLQNWDVGGLPMAILYYNRRNVADISGTHPTSKIVNFLEKSTKIKPIDLDNEETILSQFDDQTSCPTEALPKADVTSIFAFVMIIYACTFWIGRWLL